MATVACIGECMTEPRGRPDGLCSRSFGGDTFSTALYLAGSGMPTREALARPFPPAKSCRAAGIGENTASDGLTQPDAVAVGGFRLTSPHRPGRREPAGRGQPREPIGAENDAETALTSFAVARCS